MINSMQHIGIGVLDMEEQKSFYRNVFNFNSQFFNKTQSAPLMKPYTNQQAVLKQGTMLANHLHGCALELIELKSVLPKKPSEPISLFHRGIVALKVSSNNISVSYNFLKDNGFQTFPIMLDPQGLNSFFMLDELGNLLQITELRNVQLPFNRLSQLGGVIGCLIGVSSLNASTDFYAECLGFNEVYHSCESSNLKSVMRFYCKEENHIVHKLLRHEHRKGVFGRHVGLSYIELIETSDPDRPLALENRIWGDPGYIHLAFDCENIDSMKATLTENNVQITCDSKTAIDMGSGTHVRCAYIEDPDGTLIELVQIEKLPIIAALNIHIKPNSGLKPMPPRIARWLLRLK